MSLFIILVARVIRLFEFMMFARAIFSWIPQIQGSKINEFLYFATEPIVMPFRALLDRFTSMRMMPLDLSFLLAFIALEVVENLLYSLVL